MSWVQMQSTLFDFIEDEVVFICYLVGRRDGIYIIERVCPEVKGLDLNIT